MEAEVGVTEQLVQHQIEIDHPLLLAHQDRRRIGAAEILLEFSG